MDRDDLIVGAMLKALRRRERYSQTDIAAVLSLPQSVVARMERGGRRATLGELRGVCALLKISLVDFVARYVEIAAADGLPSDWDQAVADLQ